MFQRPRSDSVDSVSGSKRAGRLCAEGIGMWTDEEHERFMTAMEMYPKGPWRLVADYVGTRNARQTMTHAQKYKQKLARRQRGLRTPGRVPMRRLRLDSMTESEISNESNEAPRMSELRPHLPVVIRTGARNEDPASFLVELLTGSNLALHDANMEATMEDAAFDEDAALELTADWLPLLDFDLECPPSPISPADHVAEDDEAMWIDDYLNTMLVSLTDST